MKQLILVFSFFSFLSLGMAQGSYKMTPQAFNIVLPVQSGIQTQLKNDSLYNTLPEFEQQFIYHLNYVRLFPKEFSKLALEPYLKLYPQLRPKYGEGLKKELESMTASGSIIPAIVPTKLARLHVKDIARHDIMSHNSSNGTSMQERFKNSGLLCGSECINMASAASPLEVLLSLLIDYNVSSVGHRKSLLSSKNITVGVGVANSPSKLQYTVIDMGCDN